MVQDITAVYCDTNIVHKLNNPRIHLKTFYGGRMTNRERVLTLFNRMTPDRVPWFGDLDYWYSATSKKGQLASQYQKDGYFQLNRDLGVGSYLQGFFPFT